MSLSVEKFPDLADRHLTKAHMNVSALTAPGVDESRSTVKLPSDGVTKNSEFQKSH